MKIGIIAAVTVAALAGAGVFYLKQKADEEVGAAPVDDPAPVDEVIIETAETNI